METLDADEIPLMELAEMSAIDKCCELLYEVSEGVNSAHLRKPKKPKLAAAHSM